MNRNEDFVSDILSGENPEGSRGVYADWLEEQGDEIQSRTLRTCTEICTANPQQSTEDLQNYIKQKIIEHTEQSIVEGLEQYGLTDIHFNTGITASISVESLKEHIQDIIINCPRFDALTITDITKENAALLPDLLQKHSQFSDLATLDCIAKLAERIPREVDEKPYTTALTLSSLRVGRLKAEDMKPTIKSAEMDVSHYADSMLQNNEKFIIPVNERELDRGDKIEHINLIALYVRDLGFTNPPTTSQLLGEFDDENNFVEAEYLRELGLELCPPEIGPYQRIADTKQKRNTWYYIGMEPVAASDGRPYVFHCGRFELGLWLRNRWARSDDQWVLGRQFLFRLRKSGA